MMKGRLFFMLFAFILYSCKEFIEVSLEDKKVVLLAPGQSSESGTYAQTFWWEPVDDALSYRLQIVKPGFNNIVAMIVDTLVKGNRFNMTLDPGKYEWRVRAENGSSKSLYSLSSFIIHLSSIQDQPLLLVAPLNNNSTNQKEQLYKWEVLHGSKQYRVQIDTGNFVNETKLFLNTISLNNQLTASFVKDFKYQWRVRAESDSIYSRWSEVRTINFDNTPPDKVILNTPATSQIVPKPASLSWNSLSGAARYELLIFKSDSTTVFNSSFPVKVTTSSYSFKEGSSQEKLYWKVRALDDAGNVGPYSELRNFVIE